MERLRRQAMQLGGAGRAIEHAGGDVPVPGAQLRRIQGQVEAFLAVLEGLLGYFALCGVQERAEQVSLAVQLHLLCAEGAVVDLAVAGAELHLHGDG